MEEDLFTTMPPGRARRALSPMIGVTLLVVIVVAIAVVTGGLLWSLTTELDQPAPMVAQQGHVTLGVENSSIASQELVLIHQGGDAVDTSRMRIRIDTGSGTVEVSPPEDGAVEDGSWDPGDQLTVPLNTSKVCRGGDSLSVEVIYEGDGTTARVGSTTVPVAPGGFTIENGAVVPVTDYTAEATILGTGLTYGAGGPRIDIRLDFQIGNASYDPWPGNVNNNGNPRSHTFSDLPAEAGISVAATRDEPDAFPISSVTRWSDSSNGWVYVLRDGDTPPNIQGFGDQDSAASYVGPYLDGDGNIDIADNQAIYLFELGTSKTGPSADFQDVVVLVSLETAAETGVKRTASGRSVMVCPSNSTG